jgi:hypothetical protein
MATFAEKPAESAADPRPDSRIGPEVDRICFASTIDGWKEAKGFDDAVLLERGVNEWYLVDLSGACRARDFRFAQTIGIESRPAGGCVSRGDVILVESGGGFMNRCFISKIRKWDDDAPPPDEASETPE